VNLTPDAVHISADHGYGVGNVIVDPVNNGTLYFGTQTNVLLPSFASTKGDGLFKSTDCGATWVKIDTGTDSDLLDNGRQWTMNIDPTDPQTLYTNAGYGANGFYKSIDGGVNWTDVTPKLPDTPGAVGNTQLDPQHHEHFLLTWHGPCRPGEGCLAETFDAGKTWTPHFGNPPWVEQVRVYMLDSMKWIIPSGGLILTEDGGKTYRPVTASTDAGGHSAGQLYRAKNGYYIGAMNGVIYSQDGTSWEELPNSGQWVQGIIGDGTTMYASGNNGVTSSLETDGKTWVGMPGPLNAGCFSDLDTGHQLLYLSCGNLGIWRVRVK
jgi:photosystem II stability/assembly factor-like uncharacterized protein